PAVWAQPTQHGFQERLWVWTPPRLRDDFIFPGGIILLANCRLDDIPQLQALKTRIACLRFSPTFEEVAAMMRHIAAKGHRHGLHQLPPRDCQEVAEEIILRSHRLGRRLDLRLFVTSCQDRLQWANGASETHWKDLLDSRIKAR